MKPIVKKFKINQDFAEELYATGNYEAMYFAGIIADPKAMNESDFDRWMKSAYFYMLADNVCGCSNYVRVGHSARSS